jgi:polysaccharide export outer membrane protein
MQTKTQSDDVARGSLAHPGWVILLAMALAAPLAGCATNQESLIKFLVSAQKASKPSSEYRIMPPDVVVINAMPTEEYVNRAVCVGPDGKAFLPLVGSFQLAGKTSTQIAAELTENLRDYYQDVQVTVSIAEYRSQKYYILGEVTRPGVYPYTGNDNLLGAVANAVPTRLAWPERIYVVRGLHPVPGENGIEVDAQGHLDGKPQRIRVNLMEMAADGHLSANLALAQDDVIYVPANPFAKVGLAIQNLLLPATPAVSAVGLPYQMKDSANGTYLYNNGATPAPVR